MYFLSAQYSTPYKINWSTLYTTNKLKIENSNCEISLDPVNKSGTFLDKKTRIKGVINPGGNCVINQSGETVTDFNLAVSHYNSQITFLVRQKLIQKL
ncbi:MAG: hypothetical protein HY094_05940 [Candidatus Melainabacteria bacterium]|nr:hypothetical protein [Candidatus Melainabacteria bacterium]